MSTDQSIDSSPTVASTAPPAYVDAGDAGFKPGLSNLQIQMIALGGAVGTGLFLGVGSRIAQAGPALAISYILAGLVVYAMMRALGQMVLYRPTTGAFVSYAREFVSDRLSFFTGWIYVTLAAMIGCVEIAAVGVDVNFWFPDVPGWIPALLAIVFVIGVNLLSVRAFGVMELGAAGIKIISVIVFIIIGVIAILMAAFGRPLGESIASVTNLWEHGGFMPNGGLAIVLVMQGVVFSFSGVEIVANSAGEAKDPQRTMPKAIRSVMTRILLFYIGSVLILAMMLPFSDYSGDESPFVTALGSIGITGLSGVMNFVVLTAALSGLNATIYATARLLRNLSANKRAPEFTGKMSHRGTPVGALTVICGVLVIGVVLILFFGAMGAFELILGSVSVLILFGWITIFLSHLGFLRQVDQGLVPAPTFRAGGRVVDYICLALLGAMALWMLFNFTNPTWYYPPIAVAIVMVVLTIAYGIVRRKYPETPTRTVAVTTVRERS